MVVKARNLRPESDENENRHDASSDIQSVFVKVNMHKFSISRDISIPRKDFTS